MSNSVLCKDKGFTLIEVLLAVAIFAVISLASFSIFDGVIRSEEHSKNKIARLNDIQRALMTIERDFLQIARRSIRVEGEAPRTDFIFANTGGFSNEEQVIGFVRSGWSNPGLLIPRGDLQSVVYRLEGDTLERLHYNFVDAVVGEEPKVRSLIKSVSSLEFSYFYQKKWQENLPNGELPQAIQIVLETEDLGEISRKFLVAEAIASTSQNNVNSSNGDNQQGGSDTSNGASG